MRAVMERRYGVVFPALEPLLEVSPPVGIQRADRLRNARDKQSFVSCRSWFVSSRIPEYSEISALSRLILRLLRGARES